MTTTTSTCTNIHTMRAPNKNACLVVIVFPKNTTVILACVELTEHACKCY